MKKIILTLTLLLSISLLEVEAQNTSYANFKDNCLKYYYKDKLIEVQYKDSVIAKYFYEENCMVKTKFSTGFYKTYEWGYCEYKEVLFRPEKVKIGIREFRNGSLFKEIYFDERGDKITKQRAEEIYNIKDNLKIY